MKIKFLGTAAAEAIPGIFCDCETCKKSRELGGKNIRTRSQAIIDNKILVDFPADTYMHSIIHNIELSKIKTCIITHSHTDHLYPAELWARGPGIAYTDNETLTMYAPKDAYRKISDAILKFGFDETHCVKAQKVCPFVPFEAEGYKFTPLKANHDPLSTPVIYLIEKDGKSMLYANDTGLFPDETVEYLKKSGVALDFVNFDCTGGTIEKIPYSAHMAINEVASMREILKANGNITDDTKCVLTHFSHNGTPVHDEMSAAGAKLGFDVAYDGVEYEF